MKTLKTERSFEREMLGPWKGEDECRRYQHEFTHHGFVVIDTFFDPVVADAISNDFPCVENSERDTWHEYNNPLEIKYARTDIQGLHSVQNAFEYLESQDCIQTIEKITGIGDLQRDPFRHGAGLHCHTRGGKLDMHVDYSIHPVLGKTRCLNLIVYVTPEWNEDEWGGHLHLNGERIAPRFNRAVIFRTDGAREAYHGMPHPVTCPENTSRRSLAIYYLRNGDPLHGNVRFKAHFYPIKDDRQEQIAKENPRYGILFDIRSHRRLTPDDLWEGWERDPIGKNIWWI